MFQLSGTRNGHPKYSLREAASDADNNRYVIDNVIDALYYENGKWIIGSIPNGSVAGTSNTSPKCAEMVQSWSAGPGESGLWNPLVWGKIRCAVEDQALERCLQNIHDCNNVQI